MAEDSKLVTTMDDVENCSEEEMEVDDEETEDLSYSDLDSFPDFLLERACNVTTLQLDHNQILVVPRGIALFKQLLHLDISNNSMTYLSNEIVQLQHLVTLTARNNRFANEDLPKDLGLMKSLKTINFSGNRLVLFPLQITEIYGIQSVSLGGNQIKHVPKEIGQCTSMTYLYLGGNQLTELPEQVGLLRSLTSLFLNDNQLEGLPKSMGSLRALHSLHLHNNRLSTLPQQLIALDVYELSLRDNPLVTRFVEDMTYEPPSLLELAGRCVKVKAVPYAIGDIPTHLVHYLDSAKSCVNTKCKGVYFTSRVESVKFVDFCGKYRVPLLQYLCSPKCSSAPLVCASESEEEDTAAGASAATAAGPVYVEQKIKKVLLG